MKINIKKAINWLFRSNLELSKRWWHRLIKVVFFGIFSLIIISIIAVFSFSPPIEWLNKHNITIKSTLLDYTKNYSGNDSDYTIPKFFEEEGSFGALVNGKIFYVSQYSLEGSLCVKTPEKYLDEIATLKYNALDFNLKNKISLTSFSDILKEDFTKNPDRKCFMTTTSDLKKEFGSENTSISDKIINYHTNLIYYLEILLMVIILALVIFIVSSLIYYHALLYIVYGKK